MMMMNCVSASSARARLLSTSLRIAARLQRSGDLGRQGPPLGLARVHALVGAIDRGADVVAGASERGADADVDAVLAAAVGDGLRERGFDAVDELLGAEPVGGDLGDH